MTTATPRTRTAPDRSDADHARTGGMLVATDASVASDAALRAAAAIARPTGEPVSLLAVHLPLTLAAVEVQIPATPSMEAEALSGLELQVREQTARLGVGENWPLRCVSGEPGATIAAAADELDAELVVMGLGGHTLFDRLLGDETALRVLRMGRTPVLAVAPGFDGLPRRALACVDFSASSGAALRLASRLLAPGGQLTVAHVLPVSSNGSTAGVPYRGSIGRALDRMIAEAGCGPEIVVNRMVLAGEPAKTLLQLCRDDPPELLVTGSHGHNFLTRLRLGSVSTKLLREAGCSVLVAPPDDTPGYLEEMQEDRARFTFYEWTERLEEFTRRNAGRRATLEVIDPDIGAQVEEVGMPFIGAAFDPYDARVQLMFGTERAAHLTRNIPGITAVQLLKDRHGRDLILRIAHGKGQTLLTLER